MKNLKIRVALKFGLVLAIGYVGFGLCSVFLITANSGLAVIIILKLVALIFCLGGAHVEFNSRNNSFIAFKDAVSIGLIIIGISYPIDILFNFINYEFVLQDGLQRTSSVLVLTSRAIVLLAVIGLFVNVVILLGVILLESFWKLYSKCGQQGWVALIPVYNIIVLLHIVKRPYGGWYFYSFLF